MIEAAADEAQGGEDEAEHEDDEGNVGRVVDEDAVTRDLRVKQVACGAHPPRVSSTRAPAHTGVPHVSRGAGCGLPGIVTQALTRVRAVAVVDTGARVPGHMTPAAARDVLPHPDHGALGVQHPCAVR